jgi:LacI family transcriptional regulator
MARHSAPPAVRLPRHLTVAATLRADVQSGRFGLRLPSEPELAAIHGVSRTTVRRAIHLLVSEGVLDAQHGSGTYVRDAARSQRTIGLIVAQGMAGLSTDPYFQQLAYHLLHACSQAGWTLRLAASSEEMRQRLAAGRNDVVSACVAVFFGRGTADQLADFPVPLVLLDSDPIPGAPAILADHAEGMRQAVERLVTLGHRRIAHVPLPGYAIAGRERFAAYQTEMAKVGLETLADALGDAHASRERGYAAMGRWWAARQRPTAVICGNDLLALGASDWLREHGLQAGRDVSLIGCDGLLAVQLATPRLATVALDFAAHAAAMVAAVLKPGEVPLRRTPVRLEDAATIAPPPQ